MIIVRKCRVTSIYYNSIKHGLQLSWILVNIKLGRNSGSLNIPSIDRIVTFEVAFKFLISNCFCDKVNRFFHACVLRNAFGKSEKKIEKKKISIRKRKIFHSKNEDIPVRKRKIFQLEMVFCYQNCSNLLWEKNVLVIKNFC